jgi:hypothetical protein
MKICRDFSEFSYRISLKHDITAIQFTVFIRIHIKHGIHHNLFFALPEIDFR